MTTVTNAEHACGRDCACRAPSQLSREEEIVQLRHLRDSADERLRELQAG